MPTYLTFAEFKARTVMPPSDVDALEETYAGWILSRLTIGSSRIDARLRKRYAVPFADPEPEIVLGWLTAIVTVECYQKRGWNPSDDQSAQIVEEAARSFEEIKEASEAEEGLFELPLRENTTTDGIVKGGPFAYSEPSPWDWTDVQAEALRGR